MHSSSVSTVPLQASLSMRVVSILLYILAVAGRDNVIGIPTQAIRSSMSLKSMMSAEQQAIRPPDEEPDLVGMVSKQEKHVLHGHNEDVWLQQTDLRTWSGRPGLK